MQVCTLANARSNDIKEFGIRGWRSTTDVGLSNQEAMEWNAFICLLVSTMIRLVDEDVNKLVWSLLFVAIDFEVKELQTFVDSKTVIE